MLRSGTYRNPHLYIKWTRLGVFDCVQGGRMWPRSSAPRRSTGRLCCFWLRTTWSAPWTSNWDQHSSFMRTLTHWRRRDSSCSKRGPCPPVIPPMWWLPTPFVLNGFQRLHYCLTYRLNLIHLSAVHGFNLTCLSKDYLFLTYWIWKSNQWKMQTCFSAVRWIKFRIYDLVSYLYSLK